MFLTLGAFATLGTALVLDSRMRRLGWYAVVLSLAMIGLFVVLGTSRRSCSTSSPSRSAST